MRILIIEDDKLQATILQDKLLLSYPDVQIAKVLHSVETAVAYLRKDNDLDIILMDIILSDGTSFDIFDQVDIETPVIFITAFDQYTLQAFKVHSIDYLLKPIDEEELHKAIEKYKTLQDRMQHFDKRVIEQVLLNMQKPKYKERFMVRNGQHIGVVLTKDVLFAYAYEGSCMLVTNDGKKHMLDNSLEDLHNTLDPSCFFRANRSYLVQINAIEQISNWTNSRLKLDLAKGNDHEVIVSRDRVNGFKQWLDQ